MLSGKEMAEQFAEQGYVLLENFFASEELEGVEAVMDRFLSIPEEELAQTKKIDEQYLQVAANTFNFGTEASREPAFVELRDHPRLREATAAALGGAFEDLYMLVQVSTRGRGQPWHRDTEKLVPGHFIVNRLIYTRDIKPEAGALLLVPGSHKLEGMPPGGLHAPMEGEVTIAPRKGTLALVNSLVFHRVIPNSTDDPRFSINFRIVPEGVTRATLGKGIFRQET